MTQKGKGCISGAGLKDPVPMSASLSVMLLPLTPREIEDPNHPIEKRSVICVLAVAVMDEAF